MPGIQVQRSSEAKQQGQVFLKVYAHVDKIYLCTRERISSAQLIEEENQVEQIRGHMGTHNYHYLGTASSWVLLQSGHTLLRLPSAGRHSVARSQASTMCI